MTTMRPLHLVIALVAGCGFPHGALPGLLLLAIGTTAGDIVLSMQLAAASYDYVFVVSIGN